MEDKKAKQQDKESENTKSRKNAKVKINNKDIDDLIFADEYIKPHSEK